MSVIARCSARLSIRVVYVDPPDMIELESSVQAGQWSAISYAYTSPTGLGECARSLADWSRHPVSTCVLDAGADTAIGWLQLSFRITDAAFHVACHVQIATRAVCSESWRMSLELNSELGLIERFAEELVELANGTRKEAILEALPP